MENLNSDLYNKKLVTENQYNFLESVRTEKIVSVYYELRIILYLGIMLFTGGIGYFAYENIGKAGHICLMTLMGILIVYGFYYIRKYAKPYSNSEVIVSHSFFDYILIVVSLLIISLFAYFQVYFNLVQLLLRWTSFISALILFTMSYRYDNRALLAMGITALAAAIGITITPIDWARGELLTTNHLYLYAIFFGIVLIAIGELSYYKRIKQHFRFTYTNFGLLIFYAGCISAMFISSKDFFYAMLLIICGIAVSVYTWKTKQFLFFLYSSIALYIPLTYLLIKLTELSSMGYEIIIYYVPITCIAYIIFLVKKKSHFSND